ncbi:hypothetical protein Taro_015390 [Colocasia esculenta]|uniref:CAAX prenyl protease 2/Lysostaphin resistance protein A-like domain-containing protein n=1 Tax=Colocasia esculenta TaxID=4460 RepID=A0A843UM64_COLES|nr:hypothetical protein [Colocasia esculenta]
MAGSCHCSAQPPLLSISSPVNVKFPRWRRGNCINPVSRSSRSLQPSALGWKSADKKWRLAHVACFKHVDEAEEEESSCSASSFKLVEKQNEASSNAELEQEVKDGDIHWTSKIRKFRHLSKGNDAGRLRALPIGDGEVRSLQAKPWFSGSRILFTVSRAVSQWSEGRRQLGNVVGGGRGGYWCPGLRPSSVAAALPIGEMYLWEVLGLSAKGSYKEATKTQFGLGACFFDRELDGPNSTLEGPLCGGEETATVDNGKLSKGEVMDILNKVENFMETQANEIARLIGVSNEGVNEDLKSTLFLIKHRVGGGVYLGWHGALVLDKFFRSHGKPWRVPWTAETIIQVVLLWIVSFWFIGSWIIPFLAHAAGFSKESLTYRGQALYSLLTDIVEGLAGVAILHRCLARFRPLPSGWFHFSLKGNWQLDVVLGCLMFPLVNRLSQLNIDLVPIIPAPPVGVSSVEQSILARDPVAMALYAVVVSICAPVWEEIVFRGFLLPSLTRYMPLRWAVIVSALAFALAHFNVQRLLPLVFLGVVMGAVFARTKNLLPSMLLHSLWNGFVFLDLMR